MPNVGEVIKAEVRRLSLKEIRATGIIPALRKINRAVRAIEKRLKALEARTEKVVAVSARPETPAATAAGRKGKPGRRFVASPARLKSIRAKLNVTQKELATLLNVSGNAVWQWEAGRARPRGKSLARLQELSKTGRREARKLLAGK